MESRERTLLKRVRDALITLEETHYDLYWDIQAALDHPSLELRDHFAGLAMLTTKCTNYDDIAQNAYKLADAMLKAREVGYE
jgi:hypothetical protein